MSTIPITPRTQPVQGVFAILDIVGFTPQSVHRGDGETAAFAAHMEKEVAERAKLHGFELFKTLGDAVLLFGQDQTGGNAAEALLGLFLRLDADAPSLDAHGFKFRFRMVAHADYFTFTLDAAGKRIDIQGASAIAAFRSEKLAAERQLLVTQIVFNGLHEAAKRARCELELEKLDTPLKGLELFGHALIYHRIAPRATEADWDRALPECYREHRTRLWDRVQAIPVFGKVFAPIPMRENFVQLRLDPVTQRAQAGDADLRKHGLDHLMQVDRRASSSTVTADQLFERYHDGVILGLPGAGKSTMLRYLAWRRMQESRQALVLFVECGMLTERHLAWLADPTDGPPRIQHALRACLAIGMYPGEEIERLTEAELTRTTAHFTAAWQQRRVTVLIDAVDEALNDALRERIIRWIRALFLDLEQAAVATPGEMQHNRCFVTARLQFRRQLALDQHPVFEVQPLSLGDLQELGRRVFDARGRKDLADRFTREIPFQPAALMLGGTPIMALLLLFFFETDDQWSSRFETYELVLAFIVLRVWDEFKKDSPSRSFQTPRDYFAAVRAPEFRDRFAEEAALLDAFAWLAWDHLHGGDDVVRTLTEEGLVPDLNDWLALAEGKAAFPAQRADTAQVWFARLRLGGLFVAVTAKQYVFIHSTVFEYLAARRLRTLGLPADHLRDAASLPNRTALETLPILCGADWRIGHCVLAQLATDLAAAAATETLPYRCLAETELAEARDLELHPRPGAQKALLAEMEASPGKRWAHGRLADALWADDSAEIAKAATAHAGVLSLARDSFARQFLTRPKAGGGRERWDAVGGSSEILARRELLTVVLGEQEVARLATPQVTDEYAGYDLALTLDRPGDRDDKNIAYYRGQAQALSLGSPWRLEGFYGSPNFRHGGEVSAVAVAPDGLRCASASEDGTVAIWQVATGREVGRLRGHRGGVLCVAWSPDGRKLLSGARDQTLKLWDVAGGRELRTFTGHEHWVTSCAFQPDGRRVISGSADKTLKLWDAGSGRELRAFIGHTDWIRACAFHPDGNQVLSGSDDKTLKLWDVASGRELGVFTGHTDWIRDCAFDGSGRQVLSGSDDQTLRLWDVVSGRELRVFTGHSAYVRSCAFHPDGRQVLSGSQDQTVKLWDVASGRELRAFTGHESWVTACAFHPDGRQVLSGSRDQTLKLWDVASGRELLTFTGHTYAVGACAFHPDGHQVLSGSHDSTLKLWDVASGRELRAFTGHRGVVTGCAFHPDGRQVLSGSADNTLKLWDAASGRELRVFARRTDTISACAFHPDGRQLLSGAHDGMLRLWDVASGRERNVFAMHDGWVTACAFYPDGRQLLSGSTDHTLKLWDATSGRQLRAFAGHTETVRACAFRPDGRQVLSGSDDGTLMVWDVASGRVWRTLAPDAGAITSCGFSRDGEWLYALAEDGTLLVWNAVSLEFVARQAGLFGANALAIHPTLPGVVCVAHESGVLTQWRVELPAR